MISIGRWGNTEGVFGGFAVNPEDYHVRKLVQKKADVVTLNPVDRDEWELLNRVIDRLEVEVFLTDDIYTTGDRNAHWIPNIDKILEIDKIEITIIDKHESVMTTIPSELNEIKILSPRVPSFVLQQGQNNIDSNVRTNKGSGLIFYAIPETGDPIELATFSKKSYADTLTEDTLYTVSDNSLYFTSGGKGKDGYKLKITTIEGPEPTPSPGEEPQESDIGQKLLGFYDVTDAQDPRIIDRFGVKANGTIRPGDDFLLRSGLAADIGEPGVAGEGQFVAVYDHKLLWRVNLYIDETKNANGIDSGKEDWNNLNRWTYAQEYNRGYLFYYKRSSTIPETERRSSRGL